MRRPYFLLIVHCALLLGFFFRALPLLQNRFHPDEALYASFARSIAAGKDVLLHEVVVDKPPLPFYAMALSLSIFGGTEFAARLPHLFASLLSVAVIYRLGAALYNRATGALAALLFALSPISILFAITLFTDTLLILFALASLAAAAERKWAYAGLFFGFAFACKQTSIFFLPLIVVVGLIAFLNQPPHNLSPHSALRTVRAFALPILVCLILIFTWDIARRPLVSFWTQGYDDNNPQRLIRANELLPRFTEWLDLTQYVTGARVVDLLLVTGLPLILFTAKPARASLYDYALSGYTLSFLTAYWLLAFNVWDRYLLVLTPIMAILTARVIEVLSQHLFKFRPLTSNIQLPSLIVHLSLVTLLLPSALTASRSEFGIGGDHGAYDGIDQIAQTLYTVPTNSVLYDYWLSWQWRFYLFDSPAYVAWMPDTETIKKDLVSFGTKSPRYIVAPSWVSFTEVQTAIESVNFRLEKLQATYRRDGSLSFTLYQIKSNP